MACEGLASATLKRLRGAVSRSIARTGHERRAALAPVLQPGLTLAVESLAAGRVGVRCVAAIGGVVVPSRVVAVDAGGADALVHVDIVVTVDVDVHVMVAPVEAAPYRVHRRHA